ncbi:MAG TPA: hypothetical protein ACHBX0_03615 [Arsenophonus sp.]
MALDSQVKQARPQLSSMMLALTLPQQQHLARLAQGIHPSLDTRRIEILRRAGGYMVFNRLYSLSSQ